MRRKRLNKRERAIRKLWGNRPRPVYPAHVLHRAQLNHAARWRAVRRALRRKRAALGVPRRAREQVYFRRLNKALNRR